MPTSNSVLSLKPSAWSIDGSKLVLLSIAGIAALAIVGLLGTIAWMSFRTGVPGQDSAYTLSNYAALLTDPYNYRVMVTTLIFAAITIFVSVPLGFVFAWFIERTDMPYKALAMSLLGIGILFPTFLKAMGWVFLLHPRIGVINIFLMQLLGLESAPLNSNLDWNRLRARANPDAACLRDDLRGFAKHEPCPRRGGEHSWRK